MKRMIHVILLSLFIGDCNIPPPEVPDLPTPCDRACDVLKRAECPEGTYDMCHHSRTNECIKNINVGCVMQAKNRREIISCGVKCEW